MALATRQAAGRRRRRSAWHLRGFQARSLAAVREEGAAPGSRPALPAAHLAVMRSSIASSAASWLASWLSCTRRSRCSTAWPRGAVGGEASRG
jgi:hypothetical protein